MNLRRKIGYGALVVLILIILFPVVKIPLTMYGLEKNMHDYLINIKKYKEEEILSIDSHLGHMPTYSVAVVFTDEPKVMYVYTLRNDSWFQFPPNNLSSPSQPPLQPKHLEEKE